MKKRFFFLFLFISPCLVSSFVIAQNSSHLYKIVYVKGKPLRLGKKVIQDGQQIQDNEKIMFTTIEDVVLLLNASYEKIRLYPYSYNQLKKLIRVADFINGRFLLNTNKTSITNVRGGSIPSQYQSLSDTLRLHLVKDLKITSDTDLQKLKLFNQYMEVQIGVIKIAGEFLLIFPGKPGIFTLHYEKERGQSEGLTEIEFLDAKELNAELKYVANLSGSPDSVSTHQLRYIRKLYPNVPENQAFKIISSNR